MEIKISFNTQNPVGDATDVTQQLKDKNLRRTRVEQLKQKPDDSSLSPFEWTQFVMLTVSSGLTGMIFKSVFDFLKAKLVDKPLAHETEETKRLEIKTKHEIEITKIESAERIENKKIEQQTNFITLDFECNGKKISLKLTKGNDDELNTVMEKIAALEEQCQQ